jgi:glucose/arabinose dehydrogenase
LNFVVLPLPSNEFQLVPMVGGLNLPVSMAFAPDGRLFVNEQKSGNVRIVDTTVTPWSLQPTPWCTVLVHTAGFEQGLLGITLDPAFSTNGFVYVYRTAVASGPLPARNQVVRYHDAAGVCQGGSETVILDGIPSSDDHNGGIMQFGPDGSLYVTTGDAQNSSLAQVKTSLAGKVLRINPADGTGLPDNPFFGNASADPRVLSCGHRNIFGLTFDPITLAPVITENGPNDSDEINRIVPGGNYGWNSAGASGILNDPPNYSDVTKTIDPIAIFFPPPPGGPGGTIAPTGILPITGSAYPESMQNSLLFVDFVGGNFRRLMLGGVSRTDLAAPPITSPGGVGPLTDLKKGLDGFIYASGLGNYMQPDQGKIFLVQPTTSP